MDQEAPQGPDAAALDTLSLRLLADEIDADEAAREALEGAVGKADDPKPS